tara:strand:+ start:1696 stop:2559 length:864 start_codon:yes stop_codon:yes gene_type:complete
MKDIINDKTHIVERRHTYNKIVNIKNATELKKKYGLMEHGLGRCLEVFFGVKFKGGDKKTELRVYEIKNSEKLGQPFRCDHYAEIDGKHIVFEFNGNHHYQSPFKILTDWRKYEVLTTPSRNNYNKEFIIFKIPYYMQLTKDYAKYLFKDLAIKKLSKSFYSDEKFIKAIRKIYNTDKEELIYAPGLHSSKQTPATFNEDGIERFLQEMDDMKMYPSIQHQIVHSLKLYIKDVTEYNKIPWKKNKNWENLIIPKNKEFLRFFNFEPKEQYLNCFFEREAKNKYKEKP